MTTFGKVLVFANLVLALVFTGWAVGVVANHVDWVTPPGKSDRKGRLETLNEEIAKLARSRDATLARWRGLHTTLDRAEKQRKPRADWYEEQRVLMRTGQRGNAAEPVPVAELPALGGVDPELLDILQFARGAYTLKPLQRQPVMYRAAGLPAAARPVPLQSMAGFAAALQRRGEELVVVQRDIQARIVEQQEASDRLNGVAGKSKGLRELLEEQRVAFNASQEEMYFLQQPSAIELDDLRRLQRRLQHLQQREQELQRAASR
jgi:hypothetical protein